MYWRPMLRNNFVKWNYWESPELDGIYRFWLKRLFDGLHQKIADILNKSVQTANIAELAVESITVLVRK